MVRKGGLEPPCLLGATPSRWCVCQFHHFRAHKKDGKDPSSSRSRGESSIAKTKAQPRCRTAEVRCFAACVTTVGPYDRTQDVLNIQPVIPVRISEKWNLITRIIQLIVWQPYPQQATGGEYGLGDMNPTFFLSPAKPGKLIWGVGPAFVIPTATSDITGQGQFSLGPSIVLLAQPGHWTIGALANNVWSVAGESGRAPVNQFLLQYFLNYNLKKGYYITLQPIITANWMASPSNVWTVPFGGGIGRIMKLGFQPVNISGQFYGNAVTPASGSPWSMRLQIAFLFPKFTKGQEKMMMEQKLKQLEQEQQKQEQQKSQPKK